jgi:heme/copper-type cytochrome/quinol oxidase subunit 1
MVFFFLIPSIPATLGNFLVPMMIGAKDLAFPRINLLSWYIYLVGGLITIYALLAGGVDTGWTFYTPFSTTFSNSYVVAAGLGIFINGILVHSDRTKLHRHHSHDARAGDDVVSAASLHLVSLCDEPR